MLSALLPQISHGRYAYFFPLGLLYRSANREKWSGTFPENSWKILWLKSGCFLDFCATNIPSASERTQIPLAILACALRQIRAACSLAARQILLNSLRERERLRRLSSYAASASASESALGIILGEHPRVCLPHRVAPTLSSISQPTQTVQI